MLRKSAVVLACGIVQGVAFTGEGADSPFVRYTITGGAEGDLLGSSIATLGDVDGDGIPDFAAGAPELRGGEPGRVVVVSGRDGSIVRTLRRELSDVGTSAYGASLAPVGDLDADGIQDLAVWGFGYVEVRSGKTGDLLLLVKEPGVPERVVGIGDVDGDNAPDLAASYFLADVVVFSGRTGHKLWTRRPAEISRSALAALGDVDGDGSPDLAVGLPVSRGDERMPGALYVLKGKDGATIYRASNDVPGDSFGGSLVALSDLDGDGVPELAVGSSTYGVLDEERLGRVDVLSGRTGSPIWERTGRGSDRRVFGSGFTGDQFGSRVGNAGDVDGDGADDVLVWSSRVEQLDLTTIVDDSRVHLHSGRTGALLSVYETEELDTEFGWALAKLGDVDGDGRSEFIVAADRWSTGVGLAAGRVYVMSYVASGTSFLRGDVNLDGRVDMSDAVALAQGLMRGVSIACQESSDVDRDGTLSISDAVQTLRYLFSADGAAPDAPFPECGRLESFRKRLPCEQSSCR